MFGVGGGVLLVPLLALLFSFEQHRAQGTSLIALIPPTGVLALLAYSKEGFVSWKTRNASFQCLVALRAVHSNGRSALSHSARS